jgi:RND family efflux transporter MFP subunit
MFTRILAIAATLSLCLAGAAAGQERLTVQPRSVADEKAVFATIESVNVISARARLDGSISELRVDEGDLVEAGQVIAVVVAGQMDPQIAAVAAQVAGAQAELAQGRTDLTRTEALVSRDAAPRAELDSARTRVSVLEGQVNSLRQQRDVLVQRSREGEVLAPSAGRVLRVPVVQGAVVQPGETIAEIGLDTRVLRLRLPERHARSIHEGDPVRVGAAALTGGVSAQGMIVQVYPEIVDGRVIADAQVEGLGDFFAGERVRVYVAVDERNAIVIPRRFIQTRYGVDYVRLVAADGRTADVAVQTGPDRPSDEYPDGIEILSGVGAGDVLVAP